ncbi:hypothetical protein [Nocardiopsis sp. NRRL B-16309]|uniref:hypothetical protein n=1 Tax=Nocardiopsis sp. NRRL B-16309 TaxID=1519494 RepID=UPI0006AF735E|nr:hypothetical protein [Nocardiopsis sp. NRRL B-16309]
MTTAQLWTLVALGAFHGLHPGMGWLLAVSRGLQEGGRREVLRSLPAIALGHAASVGVAAVAITLTGSATASVLFPVAGGAVIVGVGLFMLLSRRHFHWREVRLSLWQLTAWAFLMSSAHGAGLMLMPVLAGRLGQAHGGGHGHHGGTVPAPEEAGTGGDVGSTASAGSDGAAGAAGTDEAVGAAEAQGAAGSSEEGGSSGAAGATETGGADEEGEVDGAPGTGETSGEAEQTGTGGGFGAAEGPEATGVPGGSGATGDAWSLWDATLLGVGATTVHSLAMLAAAGVAALIAYDFLGVHALRWRGVTMDRVWAVTLVLGGLFVLWSVW